MPLGTGRHRRPRQAPPFLVTASVTSSAVAISLLGASAANAANDTPWDKVAECESDGAWSANSSNGYYGGLQIAQADWEKYDGLAYALRADEASRSQQIAVAEKILAAQGTTPWPTCALLSGLTKHSGSVPVDTGVAIDSSSVKDSDPASGSDSGLSDHGLSDSSLSHSGLFDSTARPTPSAPSGPSTGSSDSATSSPSSSGSPDSSAGVSTTAPSPSPPTAKGCSAKSDGPPNPGSSNSKTAGSAPATPPKVDESDSEQGVGSWSLVDTDTTGGGTGRHRGDSAQGASTDTPASSGRHASRTHNLTTASKSHTVRADDTLTSIADSLGISGGWPALYAENKTVIGPDPDHIVPGQSLKTRRDLEEGAATPASASTLRAGRERGHSNG